MTVSGFILERVELHKTTGNVIVDPCARSLSTISDDNTKKRWFDLTLCTALSGGNWLKVSYAFAPRTIMRTIMRKISRFCSLLLSSFQSCVLPLISLSRNTADKRNIQHRWKIIIDPCTPFLSTISSIDTGKGGLIWHYIERSLAEMG